MNKWITATVVVTTVAVAVTAARLWRPSSKKEREEASLRCAQQAVSDLERSDVVGIVHNI